MTCSQCNAPVSQGARFCGQCGSSLVPAACAQCGAARQAGARFCQECGGALG
ncbi:double zinc ribbon domain-containing protein [Paraburkholderia graminis]|uniref:double zinc ribbon domain-containing protein n=1 Tax=Paraburkholderia graminis TaxID=60548 RepID=UPI00286D4F24|nr:zinc ribbon domain-containing protein [Paraburkholderia graminis]